MSKVGVMMSAGRPDAQLSSHFGKAPWVMVSDTSRRDVTFVRNEGLHGRSAVELVVQQGCTDVILTGIGQGALASLHRAQIRAWAAPEHLAGREALRMFDEEQLPLFSMSAAHHSQGEHACCCASNAGARESSCCRS